MGTHDVARHFGIVSFVIAQPALFWAFSVKSPDFIHFLGFPLLLFLPRAPRSTLSLRHRRDPVRFRSVSVKVDRAAVAALLQSEATAFAVSHRTVLAVPLLAAPLVVVHSVSRPAFLSIQSLLG